MPATNRSRLQKKQAMFQRHTAYLAGKTTSTTTKNDKPGEEEEETTPNHHDQVTPEITTVEKITVEINSDHNGGAEETAISASLMRGSFPAEEEEDDTKVVTQETKRDPPTPPGISVLQEGEGMTTPPPSTFDMRSIEEYPPEPQQRQGEASEDDPSWNPHIPLAFDQQQREEEQQQVSSNTHYQPSVDDVDSSSLFEEKKESTSPMSLFPDSADWAIEESAALVVASTANSAHLDGEDGDPLLMARATSGDNLDYASSLQRKDHRQFDLEEDDDNIPPRPTMSMEERVKMYNDASNFPRDSSSSSDEGDDENNQEDDSFEDNEEVHYVEKGSDDEEGEEDDDDDDDDDAYFSPEKLQSDEELPPPHHIDDIPVFDPSNLIAAESYNTVSTDDEDVVKNARKPVKLEGLDMIDERTLSTNNHNDNDNAVPAAINSTSGSVNSTSLVGGNILAGGDSATTTSGGSSSKWTGSANKPPIPTPLPPPPPPPPPADKKKKKQGSRSRRSGGETGDTGSIPLIQPPPEGKMKAWEEQQTRAQKHLAALKLSKSGDNDQSNPVDDTASSSTVSPVQMARVMAIQNALKRAHQAAQENVEMSASSASIPSTPVEQHDQAHSPSDDLFVGSPSKTKTSETAMSPTSGMHDQKMAEKIAMASSHAAVEFEKSYKGITKYETGEHPAGEKADDSLKPELAEASFVAFEGAEAISDGEGQELTPSICGKDNDDERFTWFCTEVLGVNLSQELAGMSSSDAAQTLLEDDSNFNKMCEFIADCVNKTPKDLDQMASFDEIAATASTEEILTVKTAESNIESQLDTVEGEKPRLKAMILSEESKKLAPKVLAANFVSFLFIAAKGSQVDSPFGQENPFLLDIVTMQLRKAQHTEMDLETTQAGPSATMQQVLFEHPEFNPDILVSFVHSIYSLNRQEEINQLKTIIGESGRLSEKTPRKGSRSEDKRFIVPEGSPSPFEACVWNTPSIIAHILSMLGDPVAVCRMKMVNRFCHRLVSEHEHVLMRDAVRAGGMSMNVRPAFWMWIALEKSNDLYMGPKSDERDLKELEQNGRNGKWHQVIQRDVDRSFGNMPPHKTGARLRTDSIVRALVTWGKNRIMKRGVKGGGDVADAPSLLSKEEKARWRSRPATSVPPWSCGGAQDDDDSVKSEVSQTPTDTVSDWGGVSPNPSFAERSVTGNDARVRHGDAPAMAAEAEELALSGNCLTPEMKVGLQDKLGFILHTLSAAHPSVGYCQGMDYVVAHLLRILQDTIRWKALNGTLPRSIKSVSSLPDLARLALETPRKINDTIDSSLVVEETIFKVMDTFFTTYNLRHMYWPELRYLKICCRVFERLIQIKLPVLADHFEHHELNIGLFALGWFQTLFLYLPSMPSATVCHMWDIWMVERSFKIFFRVGTAILFLSQPILLNHELEGMMTYLNTIPDATLLNPDILIACALNIKVTNEMLAELEAEVVGDVRSSTFT